MSPGPGVAGDESPPCRSTARRAMARPRPTPPLERLRSPSTRKNGSKIAASDSSGTPGPRSRTITAVSSCTPERNLDPRRPLGGVADGVADDVLDRPAEQLALARGRCTRPSPRERRAGSRLRLGLEGAVVDERRGAGRRGGPSSRLERRGVPSARVSWSSSSTRWRAGRRPCWIRPRAASRSSLVRASSTAKPSRARGERSSCETSCRSRRSASAGSRSARPSGRRPGTARRSRPSRVEPTRADRSPWPNRSTTRRRRRRGAARWTARIVAEAGDDQDDPDVDRAGCSAGRTRAGRPR